MSSREERSLRIEAPAKLNLTLDVLHRRPDGYHEIDSIFHAIDLVDELVVQVCAGSGIELVVRGIDVPVDPSNLAWRAADALLSSTGASRRVRIELTKRIPVGSGLGGGSSDAASVLLALDHLLGTKLSDDEMRDLAGGLGSDVPFFLTGGTARCRGRGEIVTPLAVEGVLDFVLCVPPVSVSSADLYKIFTSSLTPKGPDNNVESKVARFFKDKDIGQFLGNDLAAVALDLFPAIRSCRDEFREAAAPRPVSLTGSGSALFCPCSTQEESRRLANRMRVTGLGETYVVRSYSRAVLVDRERGAP